jgi:deoxyribonuclease-4
MSKVKGPRIGAHTPTSGGMAKRSIDYAITTGAEVIQVFASNPRGWAPSAPNPEGDQAFALKAAELDIQSFVHAPFLINLGSPTTSVYENSIKATAHSLKRAKEIGAIGSVIHTGSAVDQDHLAKAWQQIHEGMMPVLANLTESDPWLLLEPTAGQGQSLVKELPDLTKYFDALEWHPKVGVCLDTCHVFAAGHDIASAKGMKQTLDLLVDLVGVERIKLIHANDSMDVCGALKDRHENIGKGHIGSEPFRTLINHPAIANAPLVLETPGMEPEHGAEIALLKSLRK